MTNLLVKSSSSMEVWHGPFPLSSKQEEEEDLLLGYLTCTKMGHSADHGPKLRERGRDWKESGPGELVY